MERNEGGAPGGPASSSRWKEDGGGFFTRYKPEQGKWTRGGSFVGGLALVLWGGFFIYEKLEVFSGQGEAWRLLIVWGIPLLFVSALASLAWRYTYAHRGASDFLVATEGEMKKVNWSTRREVIGSTRVVIVITLMMAGLLFLIDWVFMQLFTFIHVLRV